MQVWYVATSQYAILPPMHAFIVSILALAPNHYLAAILAGMLPLLENRGAMVLMVSWAHMPPLTAFLLTTLGNLLSVALVIFGLEYTIRILRAHHHRFDTFFEKLLHRTRHTHTSRFNRFGAVILLLMTAIPIPGSGAYTAALVAYVFGVRPRSAFIIIGLGVIASGLIAFSLIHGVENVWQHHAVNAAARAAAAAANAAPPAVPVQSFQ